MRVELGATILLCQPDYAGLWHIPNGDNGQSLCRLTGDTYVYRGSVRDRRACPICLQRAPALLTAADEDAEDDGQPAPRRGKPKGKHRRVTDLQLRALHRAYVEQGLSCRQLGELVYQQLGYKSGRSCGEVLYTYFREAGLELRSQRDVTVARNLRHGRCRRELRAQGGDYGPDGYRRWLREQTGRVQPRCAAVREHYPRRGQPCQNPAMRGSDYCIAHDPHRRNDIQAALQKARATPGSGAYKEAA